MNSDNIPKSFQLSTNYPNPFNPSAVIPFALPKDSHVKIELYNILGQKVKVLVDDVCNAGYHPINFMSENQLSSGVYIIIAKMKEIEGSEKVHEFIQKITLMR